MGGNIPTGERPAKSGELERVPITEEVLNELGRSLHHRMWHLEPSNLPADEDWAALDEGDRDFYRILVTHLINELWSRGFRPVTTK
jgi:hypothetical protein